MESKLLQVTLGELDWNWIEQWKKEFKMTRPEFIRSVFAYLRDNPPTELKAKIQLSQINTMLQDAIERESEARKQREQLEKQKEKLVA